MKIYYHDNAPSNPRHPHSTAPTLPESHLKPLGILHYFFPPPSPSALAEVNNLAAERHYINKDVITISPLAMGAAYESNIQMFYEEHMHEDEEIRWILEGGGYFDVRDAEDRWVRIEVYIKAMRLFQDQPKWAALYRGKETEKSDVRKAYLSARAAGFWD
ncbi:MAG: hypothetical protein L6R42_003143 [Xanthoria sp. 1 TBL-2021]|nr:MAG: hypothetical protein L6R42_003143 [Xanthoria sp. 1 TBL-2021]